MVSLTNMIQADLPS